MPMHCVMPPLNSRNVVRTETKTIGSTHSGANRGSATQENNCTAVSVLTEGFALALIGFASCVYFQYLFIRRLYHRLTDQLPEPNPTRSFGDSLWRFIGLAQPAPC